MRRTSRKFQPSRLAEVLIPFLLGLLALGLLVTLLIVALAILGVFPAG